MQALLLTVVLAGVVTGVSAGAVANQNSWSYMVNRKASCADQYTALIEGPYFANNATCKAVVKSSLETYVKANCPNTKPGSLVWQCMNGWNGMAADPVRIQAWTSWLGKCEVLYIAQRVSTAESEDGFTWIDNSCFPRFNEMNSFVVYLSTAGIDSGARMGLINAFHILLAVFAAFLFLH